MTVLARLALTISLTLGTLGILVIPSSARAAPAPADVACRAPRIELEAQPSSRWQAAIVDACRELSALPDRDPGATVRVLPANDAVIVEVVLTDGRSALRRVKSPSALRAVLEALLTVPAGPAAAPGAGGLAAPEPSSSPPLPTPPTNVTTDLELPPPPEPPVVPTRSRLSARASGDFRAEVALSLAGRVAGTQYGFFSPTAEISLVADRWLFGLWARWDLISFTSIGNPADFDVEAVGVGLSLARRFHVGAVDLDLGVSPRFLGETLTYYTSGPSDQTRTASDFRMASFVRALVGASSFRFVATLDGELSPARLGRAIHLEPDLPALPSWSLGLAVGVAWTGPWGP